MKQTELETLASQYGYYVFLGGGQSLILFLKVLKAVYINKFILNTK